MSGGGPADPLPHETTPTNPNPNTHRPIQSILCAEVARFNGSNVRISLPALSSAVSNPQASVTP